MNLLFTVAISIVCFILLQSSNVLDDAGMAAIILNWLPLVVGLFTIVGYLLLNLITKKHSWIITIIGNLFNLLLSIQYWT